MNKVEKDLIVKFKKLEEEMIEALKSADITISENVDSKTTKVNLKKYISKVRKVESLFSEYERVAEEIDKLSCDNSSKISDAVVDLRPTEEVESVVETVDGYNMILSKKKKKKNKEAIREF